MTSILPLRSVPTIRTRVISARWSPASSAASSGERRRPFRRGAARAGRLLERANRVLRRPDGPRVRENVVAQPELVRRVRQREQRPRMSHREPPPAQIRLDLLWQSQQAERVRDRAAVPADAPGELLLRPAELAEELLVGLGLIDRIQVFSEQVLDERKLEAFGIGRVADDRRDALESGLSSSAPAAFASDDLIADASAPDDDRLDHTRRSDRRDQLL